MDCGDECPHHSRQTEVTHVDSNKHTGTDVLNHFSGQIEVDSNKQPCQHPETVVLNQNFQHGTFSRQTKVSNEHLHQHHPGTDVLNRNFRHNPSSRQTEVSNEHLYQQHPVIKQNIQLQNEKERLETNLKLKDQTIQNLVDTHTSLKDEAAKYQFALGEAKNFRFGDHVGQPVNDINGLKQNLESFCSLRRTDVNEDETKKLLNKEELNKPLIEGVLQQHIIKTVIQEANEQLKTEGNQEANEQLKPEENQRVNEQLKTEGKDMQYLEANLVSTINKLLEYMDDFSKYRVGTDEIIDATPTKLRQLVYAILGNRGFAIPDKEGEHPFIAQLRKKIVEEVNRYRTVKKPERKNQIESMAIGIIRQIISIFCFRLKVQEPVVEYKWYERSEIINPEFMEVSCDENELDKIIVDVCSFPLIGTNLGDKKYKVITQASVVVTNHEIIY
ncbi:9925_t:CDS:2 [Ambispora gerdemannii]|uniref:9925_t:CDS:1 n=1 Tax=Ambispora gerdemannii TaxID=144530 RepID=A0A9N9BID4_9GLOM|nr:9925_t:CDS:2 [Ambispora gerdemannii]